MNYIESKIGFAMAVLLAVTEARGDEAPVTLPEIVVTATPADHGYQSTGSPVVTWNIEAHTQASVDYQYPFRDPSDRGIQDRERSSGAPLGNERF